MMHTRTYALMTVSASTFDEVARNLKEAGYDHAFNEGRLDMHGIALVKMPEIPGPEKQGICADPQCCPPEPKCNCRTGCKSPTCTNC